MATNSTTTSRQEPTIEHHFDGDDKLLDDTAETRNALRRALIALQQNVESLDHAPIQVSADIRISSAATQHIYTVTVTSNGFNVDSLPAIRTPFSTTEARTTTPRPERPTQGANGQAHTHEHPTPAAESRKAGSDDDAIETRPLKRPKTKGSSHSPGQSQSVSITDEDDMLQFMKSWHTEWKHQGGWLFDNITKIATTATTTHSTLEQRMSTVQDVLGQSINNSQMATTNELANVSRLLPWLESCRKSSADSEQARAEKWRTSSASFHDQSRRHREAAEQRIEKKLEEQNQLLRKLAKVNGLDADGLIADDVTADSVRPSREESLGAQLTAELNMEAERA